MLAALVMAACTAASAFIGTICTPGTPGKHPTILLLGGSEGGDGMAPVARVFAQRGFVAVSVAYFGVPGLPDSLENVPMETFGKALHAVQSRPDVDAARIAVMGASKGGEFALLVASHYPQIHAVVADVPSPFAWQGIPRGPGDAKSSWTIAGKPVPYVAYSPKMAEIFGAAFTNHAPIRTEIAYDDAMKQNASQIPAAMFPIEKIAGPVLFLAAGDDGIWNSQAQSQLAMQYLRDRHHAFGDQILTYPRAGHLFLFATKDRALTQVPMGPFTLDMGGSPQADAAAAAEAWPKIAQFLTTALK